VTILTNWHRALRPRQNIPHIAYMSLVKAQDKTLANRRRASQRLSSRSRLKIHDPWETTRHHTSNETPSVATPTQDAIGNKHERGKPQDTTLAKRRRGSRRTSTWRRLKVPFLRTWAQGSHKTRRLKTNAERRDASHRDAESEHQNQAKKSLGKRHGSMLANRRAASRRQSSQRRH
jgi:hypothetical protein